MFFMIAAPAPMTCPLGDRNGVTQSGIYADEARRPDVNVSRDDDMRADETVISDRRVMTDVISAPQGNVVTDGDERLNGVVFEDKAIIARRVLREVRTPAADIGDELVSERLSSVRTFRPECDSSWRSSAPRTF